MAACLRASCRLTATRSPFIGTTSRLYHTPIQRTGSKRKLFFRVAAIGAAITTATLIDTVHLDHDVPASLETRVDPSTSISFPATLRIPSKLSYPPLTLLGLGVRKVSFLGIKVYSVAFYADLDNPNLKITLDMNTDEKIEHIVRNTSCVIRLVPVRTTSYTHLRDAFLRALHSRLAHAQSNNLLSTSSAQSTHAPLRKLKSLFPNTPLQKHTPLDIYLTAPSSDRPRALIFRDLGSIEHDWVATEFVLHYFLGEGPPSPPLKKSVTETLEGL